jgi:hypothetical protein
VTWRSIDAQRHALGAARREVLGEWYVLGLVKSQQAQSLKVHLRPFKYFSSRFSIFFREGNSSSLSASQTSLVPSLSCVIHWLMQQATVCPTVS